MFHEPPIDAGVRRICEAIAAAGGRPIAVGGFVRDYRLATEAKDLDIEVFGLPLERLETVLADFGEVIAIGRAFGVLRIKGINVDFSLPRRDSKVGPGHTGFDVRCEPELEFAEAARRRDLTINSIGLDPLSGEILDPHGGQRDLEAGVLRATDPEHFSEDPLRGLRVAQFIARFEFEPDDQLVALCAALDFSELSAERLFDELRKLLLKGRLPSAGLEFLRRTNLLSFFPELAALVGVPQDPIWHPEGDVWVHTLRVVDEAAKLRDDGEDDLALMFGALCHDFGKPETTRQEGGRTITPGHDVAGVALAREFLERLRAPGLLTDRVCGLVRHHLAPALFIKNGTTAKGYRRLARKLDAEQLSFGLLERVARADHFGRTTAEASARVFPAGEAFLASTREILVEERAPRDAVMGRHLQARGMTPGPRFGVILERCREIQDETGWDDPDRILNAALPSLPPEPS